MFRQHGLWFAVAGAIVWAAASLFYLAFAEGVIERAFWLYALNAALVAMAMLLLFEIVARLRGAPSRLRPRSALAFAAPGLAGAIALAAAFARLAPHASAGRYLILMLVAYGVLIAQAWEASRAVRARG